MFPLDCFSYFWPPFDGNFTIFLGFKAGIMSIGFWTDLVSISFAIFGLREVVGNLAGVIFSEASGKGSSISLAVKLPGSLVSLIASGEFVTE